MARPTISGLGKGERFKAIWPGAGFDSAGPREYRADVPPMMAFLFPDVMVEAFMRQIERTHTPLPRAEREKRVAALEREIAELTHVEEALVAAAIVDGEDVERSTNAGPQAVLGVKVVEARKSSRAA